MHKQSSMTLLAAALAGVALLGAGCSDRSSTDTVGQKMDRATDKMAATTENAANKTATAIDDTAITWPRLRSRNCGRSTSTPRTAS